MLLDTLIRKQDEMALSDEKFAAYLSEGRETPVSRTLWNGTRNGIIPLHYTIIQAAYQRFGAEIEAEVLEALRGNSNKLSQRAS